MTCFTRAATSFWRRPFEGATVYRDAQTSLVLNPALGTEERVTVVHTIDDDHTAIAVLPSILDALVRRGLPVSGRSLDEAQVRAALVDIGVTLHGADNIYYFPEGARISADEGWTNGGVRQLTDADRALFTDFVSRVSEQDQEDAQIDLDDWAAFGVVEDERLVSAASTYPWQNSTLADIGVLTLEQARGEGHGRRLVHAARAHAREHGFELQYRCQVDNHASNALASATGMELFCRWEVPTPS